MKKLIMGLALAANISVLAQPTIEIGLLLDSSGSMGGLITKTRNTLWEVLSVLDDAHKDGEVPKVSLGLYSYGNNLNKDAKDQIVMLSNLSTDHDSLSNKLFDLSASGSQEYAGLVISKSVDELAWTEKADFKALFLAGNETLIQGEVSVGVASSKATKNDIIVNTIFAEDEFSISHKYPSRTLGTRAPVSKNPLAHGGSGRGSFDSDIKKEWIDLALISGGSFAHISNNEVLPHIETPYDQMLLDLDQQLNKTFVYFGKSGQLSYQQMIDLDSQISSSSSSAMISRGRYKVGHAYKPTKWDLVQAYFDNTVELSDIDFKTLPKELQTFTQEQLIDHLMLQKQLRDKITLETKNLYTKHKEFVDKKRAEMDEKSIEMVMIESLKSQLKSKGFKFK